MFGKLCCVGLTLAALGVALVSGLAQPPAKTPEGERHDFSKVTDEQFAQMAEQVNLTEIAAGNHAASKGKRGEVQQLAQKLVKDHTAANAKLTTAIGANFKMAGKLDEKHQAKVDKLTALSGDEFDRAYVQEMIKGHQMAAALMEHQATNGKDANLKAYAAEILPGVKTHLQMAQNVWKTGFANTP